MNKKLDIYSNRKRNQNRLNIKELFQIEKKFITKISLRLVTNLIELV